MDNWALVSYTGNYGVFPLTGGNADSIAPNSGVQWSRMNKEQYGWGRKSVFDAGEAVLGLNSLSIIQIPWFYAK